MAKLIAQIQNYPLSSGSTTMNNVLLQGEGYAIKHKKIKDDFNLLAELAKNIQFFDKQGAASSTWNDLLKKDAVFQLAQFLTLAPEEIHRFFTELPQVNHFTNDAYLSQLEYETLAYQRFQILQHLFFYYKVILETFGHQAQVLAILKQDGMRILFMQYEALYAECSLLNILKKKEVTKLNGIDFKTINSNHTKTLKAFFAPGKKSKNQVLDIYANNYEKVKAANKQAYAIFKGLLHIHKSFGFWANGRLEELLTKQNDHQAHSALLIAFCQIKSMFDARYNHLVEQQSRFIYEEILQFEKEKPLPDQAQISLILAADSPGYFLAKGTLFKAGKNSDNKVVYYSAMHDLSLNQGKVDKIMILSNCVQEGVSNLYSTVWEAGDPAQELLPINLKKAWTGLAFESKLLALVKEENTRIELSFEFEQEYKWNDQFDYHATDFVNQFAISLLAEDGTKQKLFLEELKQVKKDNAVNKNKLCFCVIVDNEIKKTTKKGINARIELVSPEKNEQVNEWVKLYQYLSCAIIRSLEVSILSQQFTPSSVDTATGTFGGAERFIAFGAQSLAGSSFRIADPYFAFAKVNSLQLNWAENIKNEFKININSGVSSGFNEKIIKQGDDQTLLELGKLKSQEDGLTLKLVDDVTYDQNGITLCSILSIKGVQVNADLLEQVYLAHASSATKNDVNALAALHPFGELLIQTEKDFTLLPRQVSGSFSVCYIGLKGIQPGQELSLLFEIEADFSGQERAEAPVLWYCLSGNALVEIETSRLIDDTQHLQESGRVAFTLPLEASSNNTLLSGADTYWLVLRSKLPDAFSHIKSVETNALSVQRVLDENNQEAKVTVPAHRIENVFPKTPHIKSLKQSMPSQGGRTQESDALFLWRSSQLLRHKGRGITQWDFEQLVLSNFPSIYHVKCLNHAHYIEKSKQILAKARHTLLTVLPHYRVNEEKPNFTPSLSLSKLKAIKDHLSKKTSAFNRIQVLNTKWDVIYLELTVQFKAEVLDHEHFKLQLNQDLQKLLAPWAFDSKQTLDLDVPKLYTSALVNAIDELSYIDHIGAFKVFKNTDNQQFDEIIPSSEIHAFTSAVQHNLFVKGAGHD